MVSLVPILTVSTKIVAPEGSVSKKTLPPALSGVVVAVAAAVVRAVVVASGVAFADSEAADVIPVWASRSRKARQTKNWNRFIPVLPKR